MGQVHSSLNKGSNNLLDHRISCWVGKNNLQPTFPNTIQPINGQHSSNKPSAYTPTISINHTPLPYAHQLNKLLNTPTQNCYPCSLLQKIDPIYLQILHSTSIWTTMRKHLTAWTHIITYRTWIKIVSWIAISSTIVLVVIKIGRISSTPKTEHKSIMKPEATTR